MPCHSLACPDTFVAAINMVVRVLMSESPVFYHMQQCQYSALQHSCNVSQQSAMGMCVWGDTGLPS